tara:strand:+ start:115 stop:1452 length:1338 start_codon:yes stop_codon:yes gene_type:complete
MKTSVKFINHASVVVSDENISVLSDPWFSGDAFHKGWNLLHETGDNDIKKLLQKITHIWISHEHPDHFSISFFQNYSEILKNNSIKILFQKTSDKRVFKFLTAKGLNVKELEFNKSLKLSDDFTVKCIKDGFYDSGLLIDSHGDKILNLNDCEVTTPSRAKEVFSLTGKVDVLLTQFSYAAWKGGTKNKRWRVNAAQEKINTIKLQTETFRPKYLIPFASFFYFSNKENFYLNDSVNRPEQLEDKLQKYLEKLTIMAPNDVLGGKIERLNNIKAINFWKNKYEKLSTLNQNQFSVTDLNILNDSFKTYCERIEENNNLFLVKIIRIFSPIRAFKPIIVKITDLNLNLKFDYVNKKFSETSEQAMLSMKSESLNFLFKNSFGFDTLTVNGCFEEVQKNGFVRATKTLAIENLNNLGIKIELKTLFNISIIKLFLTRLYRVSRKLDT